MEGGGPSQEKLMENILSLEKDANGETKRQVESVKTFLRDTLNIPEKKFNELSLEDVYTPIDRCISDGMTLRGLNKSELTKIRAKLGQLISKAIELSFSRSGRDKAYATQFAKYLVGIAKIRAEKANGDKIDAKDVKQYDPVSVISLNWDILLDNAINDELKEVDNLALAGSHPNWKDNDYAPFGVVDYCCYVSSLEKGDKRIRAGLWTLGCRGYNVKLLKIHGSLNWLQCQNCQRLFIKFDKKIGIMGGAGKQQCHRCEEHDHKSILDSTLVMPTYLKDLSNFQLKLIWQNASIELMEATRIVFIGYSLPNSDFEFRQILTRMVHKDCKIDAVLFSSNPKSDSTYESTCKRYSQFFADKDVAFHHEGTANFISKLVNLTMPPNRPSMESPLVAESCVK